VSIWTADALKLFVSHISPHKEIALNVKETLTAYSISAFVAHTDIEPTAEWQTEIESALQTMDALLAILTPGFHESRWTDQEVGFALGRGLYVIPLRHGVDPYGFIGKFQGYQITGLSYAAIAETLAKLLAKHYSTAQIMSRVLVSRFEQSWSWEGAKKNMDNLEFCTVFDEELLTRIETATQTNGQISSAWGVPERVATLLKKFRTTGA